MPVIAMANIITSKRELTLFIVIPPILAYHFAVNSMYK